MANLKAEITEIVEIVSLVPEPFKNLCFELLLKNAIASSHINKSSTETPPQQQEISAAPPVAQQSEVSISKIGSQPKVAEGADITHADLHMKARKFLEKGEISLEQLNNLFYKEGEGFESLVTDLGATGMSEGQIRIGLFQCLHQALINGEFSTTVEAVREECKMRKCYDATNFTKNFKNNAETFDFGEWTKETQDLRLSEQGRRELASLVKTLK